MQTVGYSAAHRAGSRVGVGKLVGVRVGATIGVAVFVALGLGGGPNSVGIGALAGSLPALINGM